MTHSLLERIGNSKLVRAAALNYNRLGSLATVARKCRNDMEENNEQLDAPALVRLYENAGTVMEFIELVAAEVKKRDERHAHDATQMELKAERSKRAIEELAATRERFLAVNSDWNKEACERQILASRAERLVNDYAAACAAAGVPTIIDDIANVPPEDGQTRETLLEAKIAKWREELKAEGAKRAIAERLLDKASAQKIALIDAIVAMHQDAITTPYEES